MIQVREIGGFEEKSESDRHLPKVIKWKGVNMVRNHSFLATVREIIDFSEELDLVNVRLIGDPHSGKSTLAEAIAHCIHKNAKIPYAIRIFTKEDLLNFEQTLKGLQPANYILVFDDVSFLKAKASQKQIDLVKQAATEIRHLPGGKDVKIISIMNYHYTLGLDKYLRQADFYYFTTVGSSEKSNMENIAGTKYLQLITQFQQMRRMAVAKKYFSLRIGPKEFFSYKYRNPFIPCLFWNNDKLRLVVTPRRQWIDPICTICSVSKGEKIESDISLPEFCKACEDTFGEGNWKAAIKLSLYMNGLTVYGKNVVKSLRYLAKKQMEKVITLEQLATHYNFEVTKTRVRKSPDDIMDLPE